MSDNIPNSRIPSRERVVLSGKLKINIVEWGQATAHTIIMLHGLRAYAQTWDRVAQVLAKKYHVIALDQRGRGKSDWGSSTDYFTPNYVEDLKNVIDGLGLNKFTLLGHSMGGATALVFSQMYPGYLDGLVVEDIGPGSSAASNGADRIKKELNNTPRLFRSRAEAKLFWQEARPGAPDEAIEQRLKYMMVEDKDGTMKWRYDLEGISEARLDPDILKIPDLWPPVLNLNIPTLVLRGENSDFLSQKVLSEMAQQNSNIKTFEISNASHYIHDDNFPEFMTRLEPFLAELYQIQLSGKDNVK
jgi:pimeloyl-ACP methyl ester carboxylesterase|tara:strand:+ start:990 stop:1895 length:906 start_codon:yes stop_codon:yes gene_type:complete